MSQKDLNKAESSQETPEVIATKQGMFGGSHGGDTSGYGGLVTQLHATPAAQRPYGSYFDEIADVLVEVLDDHGVGYDQAIEKVVVDRGELTIHVVAEHLATVAQYLRDDQDLRFEMCVSVSGVHYPEDKGRELHVVYHFVSITHARRVRLEVAVSEDHPHLPSLVAPYPAVDWHERETYDMFGVIFDGHPALTRILMPDDWPGHPQRKDYPLGGIPVEYKGASIPPPDTRRSYR